MPPSRRVEAVAATADAPADAPAPRPAPTARGRQAREPTPPPRTTGRRGALPSSPPDPGGGGGGGGPPGSPPHHHATVGGDDEGPAAAAIMDSVVKVYGTHAEPNYSLPWQRRRQTASTSSGFIIPGRRLITNAHCVEHGRIKVRRRGQATKYAAKIIAVGPECDLALLEVPDPEFWVGAVPVRFGDTPLLQQKVVAVGFPLGGDSVCATSGVVSRVEIQPYTHGACELLALSLDAAINSGASGGAVFCVRTMEVVGVSFQS